MEKEKEDQYHQYDVEPFGSYRKILLKLPEKNSPEVIKYINSTKEVLSIYCKLVGIDDFDYRINNGHSVIDQKNGHFLTFLFYKIISIQPEKINLLLDFQIQQHKRKSDFVNKVEFEMMDMFDSTPADLVKKKKETVIEWIQEKRKKLKYADPKKPYRLKDIIASEDLKLIEKILIDAKILNKDGSWNFDNHLPSEPLVLKHLLLDKKYIDMKYKPTTIAYLINDHFGLGLSSSSCRDPKLIFQDIYDKYDKLIPEKE